MQVGAGYIEAIYTHMDTHTVLFLSFTHIHTLPLSCILLHDKRKHSAGVYVSWIAREHGAHINT